MTKKLYVVECCSTFRTKYVVSAEKEPLKSDLQNLIDNSELIEWDQQFLGEKLVGIVPTTYNDEDLISFSVINELTTDESVKTDDKSDETKKV